MFRENPVKYLILLSSTIDKKIDVENACKLTKVSVSTVKKYLSSLVKEGYLEKREDGYYLTTIGEKLLNVLKNIQIGFQAKSPYVITDPPSGSAIPLSFRNYKQLLSIIECEFIDRNIVEYHFEKYMIEWIKNSLGDEFLLDLINKGIVKNIDDLENYLKQIIELENIMKERIT